MSMQPHIRLVQPIGETALFRVISVEYLTPTAWANSPLARHRTGWNKPEFCWRFTRTADLAYLEKLVREESSGDLGI